MTFGPQSVTGMISLPISLWARSDGQSLDEFKEIEP